MWGVLAGAVAAERASLLDTAPDLPGWAPAGLVAVLLPALVFNGVVIYRGRGSSSRVAPQRTWT
jgi:hypothetical protein